MTALLDHEMKIKILEYRAEYYVIEIGEGYWLTESASGKGFDVTEDLTEAWSWLVNPESLEVMKELAEKWNGTIRNLIVGLHPTD